VQLLGDRRPLQTFAEEVENPDAKWIMISYNWDFQAIVQRVVASLQSRGYIVWYVLRSHYNIKSSNQKKGARLV